METDLLNNIISYSQFVVCMIDLSNCDLFNRDIIFLLFLFIVIWLYRLNL